MATPLYPAKVAERERVRNQKILQDKLERLEGQRRSTQDQLLAKIEKQEMQMERRILIVQEEKSKVSAEMEAMYTGERKRALLDFNASVQADVWNDGLWVKPQQVGPSYPFALRLTGVMQRYLDGQRLSASSAEVIRAEILEPSSSGMVKVCVVFKRNGSAYVDQFSITLEDIRSRGGLTDEQCSNISKADNTFEQTVRYPTYGTWANASDGAVSELRLKTLEIAYDLAMLGSDQSGAQLAMRQLLDKPKEEKPITALDVILTPGHRMIEI